MTFRIDPARQFGHEVKTVAVEQLTRAIAALEEQPDGLHEAIHEARKKFKRIRGLYRLVAKDRPDFRRAENIRLRDTARSLSSVRDATALIETVTYLGEHAESSEETEAVEHTRTALAQRRDAIAAQHTDLADRAQAAVESCRAAIDALEGEHFPDSPKKVGKALGKAWKKSLARARLALAACRDQTHAELFHELRKCAQVYWMHLSLLRDLWPSAFGAKRTQAKRLVDMLGHEHDISLLVDLLDAEPAIAGSAESQSHLLGLIIRQQQLLRHQALDLADHVFADEPDREAGIVTALWIEAAKG